MSTNTTHSIRLNSILLIIFDRIIEIKKRINRKIILKRRFSVNLYLKTRKIKSVYMVFNYIIVKKL
jgi:hypothetical protein